MGFGKRASLPAPGAAAPEFRLRNLEGGETVLADLVASGPALLAFFKVSCPVCQLALPFLQRIHEGAGGSMRIYGISQDDARDTRAFNREFGITFPVLLDSAREQYPASNAYGITHVPTLFLVEPGGAISRVTDGFVRRDLQALGDRAGVSVFRPGEYAPEWKAG